MTARTIPTDLLTDLLGQFEAITADKRKRGDRAPTAWDSRAYFGYANGMESAAFLLRLLLERQESDETPQDGAYGAGCTDDGSSTRVDL